MNYNENIIALAELYGDSAEQDDPDFLAILPATIQSAENRILRDLDLLSTRVQDDTGKLTQNRKLFVLPSGIGTFIVLEQLRVLAPPTPGAPPAYGPPLLPTSKDAIDALWLGDSAPSSPSIPNMWAPIDQATVVVGPPPDQDYGMSTFGTQRPKPLSAQNPVTFISTQLPDLFLAAEMIFLSSHQRNWSARSDDPQTSASWLNEYNILRAPALVEEVRKKLQAVGWSTRLPSPIVDAVQFQRL